MLLHLEKYFLLSLPLTPAGDTTRQGHLIICLLRRRYSYCTRLSCCFPEKSTNTSQIGFPNLLVIDPMFFPPRTIVITYYYGFTPFIFHYLLLILIWALNTLNVVFVGKMELSLYFYGFLYTKGNSKMVHFYCSHVTKQLLSTLNATSHVKRLEEALEASSLLYLRSSKRQRHLKYIVLHRRRRRSVATFFFFFLTINTHWPLAPTAFTSTVWSQSSWSGQEMLLESFLYN